MRTMFKNIKKKFSKDSTNTTSGSTPKGKDSTSATKDKDSRDAAEKKSAKEKTKRKQENKPVTFPSNGTMDPNADTQPVFSKEDLLKSQVKLVNASAAERPALFIKKVRLCTVSFDWDTTRKESPEDTRAKEVKRELLLEVLEQVNKNRAILTEAAVVELLKMVEINMFRTLPVRPAEHSGDEDEDEPLLEPAWSHLEVIYEIFVRVLVSNDVDVKILKKHVNSVFVLHILDLFDSEDPRERDALKTTLHRIYAKFMSLRAFIRKAINNSFYSFIYESEQHNGVAELLEILGSIINGFALPLKQEHKQFLEKVLIPMHKVKPLAVFHQQLAYCVTQFVNKDPPLAVPLIKGLLKYWPVTNSQKEVLFLNELEEVLEMTQPEEFKRVMVPVFKQLSRTIGSPHFQVAERALFMWQNEYISSLIAANRDVILPLLYPVLHVNSQHHWNPTVNNLTVNVLKIFMDMDQALVADCSQRYAEEEKQKERARKQRQDTWRRLEEQKEKFHASYVSQDSTSPNHSTSSSLQSATTSNSATTTTTTTTTATIATLTNTTPESNHSSS